MSENTEKSLLSSEFAKQVMSESEFLEVPETPDSERHLRKRLAKQVLNNAKRWESQETSEDHEVYLLTKLPTKQSDEEYQGITKITWIEMGRHPEDRLINVEFKQVNASTNETFEGYPVTIAFVPDEFSKVPGELHSQVDTIDLAMMAAMSDPDKAKLIGKARYEDFE